MVGCRHPQLRGIAWGRTGKASWRRRYQWILTTSQLPKAQKDHSFSSPHFSLFLSSSPPSQAFFVCFGASPGGTQGSLLALCSGISSGGCSGYPLGSKGWKDLPHHTQTPLSLLILGATSLWCWDQLLLMPRGTMWGWVRF